MLRVNNLIGFGARPTNFEFGLVGSPSSVINTVDPTFSSVPFGAPRWDRHLIAAFSGGGGGFDLSWTMGGVTIGGVAATVIGLSISTSESSGSCIAIAKVPNGASGDVAINTTNLTDSDMDWQCRLYRAVGLKSATPLDSYYNNNADSVTLNTSGARFVVLAGHNNTNNISALSGGGATVTDFPGGWSAYWVIGYDPAPLGGASDVYDTDGDTDSFIGACWA